MTRSAFGPAWDKAASRRRLEMTKAVTAPLMARQTTTDWTWVVLLDEQDPCLRDRMSLYRDSAPAFIPIVTRAVRRPARGLRERRSLAAGAYHLDWRADIPADDTVLTTRIDDDDGFAPDALARFQAAAAEVTERTALMLPMGIRVWRSRYTVVRHERNAMHTLVTPPGDMDWVYSYGHTKVAKHVPVRMLDDAPGWLWVRHVDTISDWRRADILLTNEIRAIFPGVNWKVVNLGAGLP